MLQDIISTILLIHLINVALVYVLVNLMFKETIISTIVALLFAIHPMHGESVLWVAERKDVLYTLFYLASIIFYLRHIRTKDLTGFKNLLGPDYLLTFILFICALLSKSMAVTLPVVLILFDWFYSRKFSINQIIEKIPFFALSILFGIIAIISQKASGAVNKNILNTNIADRFFMLNYSVSFYLTKLVAPFRLSAIHSFPIKATGYLPIEYYLSPLLLIVIIFLIFKSGKMKKVIIFGTLFFLITISVVLMVIPVGFALVAERYTYVPYIGLFIIGGSFYNNIQERTLKYSAKIKPYVLPVLVAYCIIFSIITYNRIDVWKDGMSLYTDIIEKYPDSGYAYINRGYLETDQPEIAMADFNKGLALNPNDEIAFCNRGLLKANLDDYKGALEDYNKAISLKRDFAVAYFNRGISRLILKDTVNACDDWHKAVEFGYKDANNKIEKYCK